MNGKCRKKNPSIKNLNSDKTAKQRKEKTTQIYEERSNIEYNKSDKMFEDSLRKSKFDPVSSKSSTNIFNVKMISPKISATNFPMINKTIYRIGGDNFKIGHLNLDDIKSPDAKFQNYLNSAYKSQRSNSKKNPYTSDFKDESPNFSHFSEKYKSIIDMQSTITKNVPHIPTNRHRIKPKKDLVKNTPPIRGPNFSKQLERDLELRHEPNVSKYAESTNDLIGFQHCSNRNFVKNRLNTVYSNILIKQEDGCNLNNLQNKLISWCEVVNKFGLLD